MRSTNDSAELDEVDDFLLRRGDAICILVDHYTGREISREQHMDAEYYGAMNNFHRNNGRPMNYIEFRLFIMIQVPDFEFIKFALDTAKKDSLAKQEAGEPQ